MGAPTFIQRAFGGMAIFQVAGGCVEVSTTKLRGRQEHRFPLAALSAEYNRRVRYHRALGISLLCFSALLIRACWWLVEAGDPYPRFMEPLLPFIATGVALGFRALLPSVSYDFRLRDGTPAFRVHREYHQRRDCDAFVAALVVCIEAAARQLPAQELSRYLDSLVLSPPKPLEVRWLGALVCGVLAAALPLVPGYAQTLAGLASLPLLGLNAAAVILAAFSFIAKERRKWLALAGVAVAWLAPLFW